MSIDILRNIAGECPKNVRLMGLDLGKKTIGVAVSDSMHSIASAIITIKRTKFTKDILELDKLIKEFEIGGFVVGLPLNMDGSEGTRCQSVRDFSRSLLEHPDIFGADPWIALQDERLSTDSVDSFLIESVDMTRTRRKQVIDKLAAQVILQGALDYISQEG